MPEQIISIKIPIDRDDLDAVLTGLEVACGGIKIAVTEVFDLIVKDERQAAALRALFGENGKPEEVVIKRKAGKKPLVMGKNSYRFEGTWEIISKQALNKRLAGGDASLIGMVFVNAKGERFHAINGDDGGPARLVDAGKLENAA